MKGFNVLEACGCILVCFVRQLHGGVKGVDAVGSAHRIAAEDTALFKKDHRGTEGVCGDGSGHAGSTRPDNDDVCIRDVIHGGLSADGLALREGGYVSTCECQSLLHSSQESVVAEGGTAGGVNVQGLRGYNFLGEAVDFHIAKAGGLLML